MSFWKLRSVCKADQKQMFTIIVWGIKHHNLRENKITSTLFGAFKNDSRISERRSKFLDKVIKTH